MAKDPRDETPKKIIIDGKIHHIIPEVATKTETHDSGFTTYDTTYGHCAFCGRLSCNSTCFK